MKYVITGPRSVGKSTVGKILAKKLEVEYISSDDEMDVLLKEYGGIDGATKAGMMNLIIDVARDLVRKILEQNNILLDLAGGALKRKYYNELIEHMKQETIMIGLIPSLDDKKATQLLYQRERQRSHFDNLTDEELLTKTRKDYLKIKEPLQIECKLTVIVEGKTPEEIVEEIANTLN